MATLAVPRCPESWESNGLEKPYLHAVHPGSEEWSGVESHVHTLGGSEVQDLLQILRIERNENWHLYSQYASYCNGLEKQNEMYLFHGSPDTTNQIMDDGKGLDTAYASQASYVQTGILDMVVSRE